MPRSEHEANEWLAMQQDGRFISKPQARKQKASWTAFWVNVAGVALFACLGVLAAWRF
jgi:hypothetical protein